MDTLYVVLVSGATALVFNLIILGLYAVLSLRRLRSEYPRLPHPPFWRDFWRTFGPKQQSRFD